MSSFRWHCVPRLSDRLANYLYAAPEQKDGSGSADHRADIYALGLILNEVFTGKVPQGSGYKNIASVLEAYAFLDPVVEKMISQNPSNRHQSILDVLRDIKARERDSNQKSEIAVARDRIVEIETKDDNLISNPVEIVDYKWQNGNLLFYLSRSVNQGWIQCFKADTTMSMDSTGIRFGPKYFPVSNSIITFENVRQDKKWIERAVREMPIFVSNANAFYARMVLKKQREAEEKLEQKRQSEINKNEIEVDMNAWLQGL
jgi:serine/threonine protein kinase